MWYYSTPQQFELLLGVLDADEMEAPLVRELLEMKHEIIRQMEITDRLTNQAKGNRKSYLEVENNNIIKLRKLREERKQQEHSLGLTLDDDKTENSTIDGDSDVVNEVTVTSEDAPHDDDDHNDAVEGDVKKIKNNTTNKNKKKIEESKLTFLYVISVIAVANAPRLERYIHVIKYRAT